MFVFLHRHLDILIAVVLGVIMFSIGINLFATFTLVLNIFTCYQVIRNQIKHKAVVATLEECAEYCPSAVKHVKLAIEAMDNFSKRHQEQEENMVIINQNIQTLNANMALLVKNMNKLKAERKEL
jgi:hypothetical protein